MSAKEDINVSTAFSTLTREMIIAAIANQAEEDDSAERHRTTSFQIKKQGAGARKQGGSGCKC